MMNSAVKVNSFTTGKIPFSRQELNLGTVLTCGQSFRWRKYENQENSWIGIHKKLFWILTQNSSGAGEGDTADVTFKVYPKIKNSDAIQILSDYFQSNISLMSLYQEWSDLDPNFRTLTQTHQNVKGIRILHQEPVETIFSFICSSNNNIKRISSMIEKLCLFYGEEIVEFDGEKYYSFPEVRKLQGVDVEAKLRQEGFGYRAKFITKSAEIIVDKGEQEWIKNLYQIGYEGARIELQSLHGVGRKVADCICLMAFGYHEAVPVDTHIHQIAKSYLPNLAKNKTLTDKGYTEITEYFRKIHGPYAGWAQSVLFSSRLPHLKRKRRDSSEKVDGD